MTQCREALAARSLVSYATEIAISFFDLELSSLFYHRSGFGTEASQRLY